MMARNIEDLRKCPKCNEDIHFALVCANCGHELTDEELKELDANPNGW